MVELAEGLDARPQAGFPSLDLDLLRSLDLVAPLWSAGFYNKTFTWPGWHTYEGLIRRMAGLGQAPAKPDPDRYDIHNAHCDVLIVGAGKAGLRAARDSGRAGARVMLVEQQPTVGGAGAWDGSMIGNVPTTEWLAEVSSELAGMREVRVLKRTTAVGVYDHNVVTLLERRAEIGKDRPRERLWLVRAQRIVLATGVVEQPLIFDNNDRPGVVLAGAARQYLRRYGVSIGARVLVATNNDSAYALALDLAAAGVRVLTVVDSRPEGAIPKMLRDVIGLQGIGWSPHSIPTNTAGFGALSGVTIGRLSSDARGIEATWRFACDALAVSGGFSSALQLYAQAGGRLAYDEASGSLQTLGRHPSVAVAGSASTPIAAGPRISPVGRTRRQWVDLLHDVTVADLELALRENYTHIEHVKRYTTVGMAPDQGKTSASATLDVLARLRAVAPASLGATTQRPPLVPVTLGTLAGRDINSQYAPKRELPIHHWHIAHGAILHDFGGWQRPVAYLRDAESREQATFREARTVRSGAGLFDASPLGKIELHGPDALEFVDRFYINNLKTLLPGKVRYGLMLRETGTIFDDGTVVALARDHLLITTTSGNAGRVYQWLEEWHQCEWPHLRVAMTPVTEEWATLSLAGPEARAILTRVPGDVDLSPTAFPHLTVRQGRLLNSPARIYRVSFTGELSYEINVPADVGTALWQRLLSEGADAGLQPVGLDAIMQLRLEKGFLHVGGDTDGTTVPDDVGWGKVASGKTADFIGRRSLTLSENRRSDRLQLVGLVPVKSGKSLLKRPSQDFGSAGPAGPSGPGIPHPPVPGSLNWLGAGRPLIRGVPHPGFVVGSHLRLNDSDHRTDGWITSAGAGALDGNPIALAMLRSGRSHLDAVVTIYDDGKPIGKAAVVNPPFYDPKGERMNA
jgi:sarcosine oxidase subunit alpha